MKNNNIIIVWVDGGIVQDVTVPDGYEYHVHDYDNLKDSGEKCDEESCPEFGK